jgi:hypothetical protein
MVPVSRKAHAVRQAIPVFWATCAASGRTGRVVGRDVAIWEVTESVPGTREDLCTEKGDDDEDEFPEWRGCERCRGGHRGGRQRWRGRLSTCRVRLCESLLVCYVPNCINQG